MKEWEEPQLFDLSVKETMGGAKYTPEADGAAIYDKSTNKWWTPSGQS